METTNNRNYITSIIAVVVIIALIAGAYLFDHRNDKKVVVDTGLATTTDTTATSTPMPVDIGGGIGNTPKTPATNIGGQNFIKLETYNIVVKSDISGWTTYSNSGYKFSLKYPGNTTVRKFIDGKNSEYGIGLTLSSANSHFADKYFELITDSSETTVCDALLPEGTKAKTSTIEGMTFIRNEFTDGSSHVVEYNARARGACYSASLRLNGAPGTTVSSLGANEIKTEIQILEDIMSTFRIVK